MQTVKVGLHGSVVAKINEPLLIKGSPDILISWFTTDRELVSAHERQGGIVLSMPDPIDVGSLGQIEHNGVDTRYIVRKFERADYVTITYSIVQL